MNFEVRHDRFYYLADIYLLLPLVQKHLKGAHSADPATAKVSRSALAVFREKLARAEKGFHASNRF